MSRWRALQRIFPLKQVKVHLHLCIGMNEGSEQTRSRRTRDMNCRVQTMTMANDLLFANLTCYGIAQRNQDLPGSRIQICATHRQKKYFCSYLGVGPKMAK